MNIAANKFSEIKHFDHLKHSGLQEKQAKAILNLVIDANAEGTKELATKDYVNLRIKDVEKEIHGLELKMERRFNTLFFGMIISILVPIILHLFVH